MPNYRPPRVISRVEEEKMLNRLRNDQGSEDDLTSYFERTQFRDMCYWGMSKHTLPWNDAGSQCEWVNPGEEMVTIHDLEQNAFIAKC